MFEGLFPSFTMSGHAQCWMPGSPPAMLVFDEGNKRFHSKFLPIIPNATRDKGGLAFPEAALVSSSKSAKIFEKVTNEYNV